MTETEYLNLFFFHSGPYEEGLQHRRHGQQANCSERKRKERNKQPTKGARKEGRVKVLNGVLLEKFL